MTACQGSDTLLLLNEATALEPGLSVKGGGCADDHGVEMLGLRFVCYQHESSVKR